MKCACTASKDSRGQANWRRKHSAWQLFPQVAPVCQSSEVADSCWACKTCSLNHSLIWTLERKSSQDGQRWINLFIQFPWLLVSRAHRKGFHTPCFGFDLMRVIKLWQYSALISKACHCTIKSQDQRDAHDQELFLENDEVREPPSLHRLRISRWIKYFSRHTVHGLRES